MNSINQLFVSLFLIFSLIDYSSELFIAKGTLWCGVGNQAKNCSDLGELKETDNCCRQHDMCPYKYTNKNRQHNGFKWSRLFTYTLSHCECDMKFKNCLNDGTHKKGSTKIWHTYSLLQIKCFAFLPCNETYWSELKNKKTGICVNDYKVVAFNTVNDYLSFMNTHLNTDQKKLVNNLLNENLDKFYSPKNKNKKYINCVNDLSSYKLDIVNQYNQHFLFNLTTNSSSSIETKINFDEDTVKSKSLGSLSRDAFIKILSIFTKK